MLRDLGHRHKVRKDVTRRKHALVSAPKRRSVGALIVSRIAGSLYRGKLVAGPAVIPCVLGRSGTVRGKREGDGATPIGMWRLTGLKFRADQCPRPQSLLRRRRIDRNDGWCDDPSSWLYNRPIRLPAQVGHERLWREDGLYDLIIVLDYNLRRPIRGRGSAIFFHLASPDRRATQGCVAIDRAAMLRLLPRLGSGTRLRVLA